jgi:hypothetical protein
MALPVLLLQTGKMRGGWFDPEQARGRSRRSVLSIVSFAWPGRKARLNCSSLLFLSCFFSEKAFLVDLSSSLLAGFTWTPGVSVWRASW